MREITEDIIVKASQGDLDAFQLIYKAYFRFVANVAYRVVNRREDAEDVTQEAFMNVYRNLDRFRFESSFKTWVYRITVNTAVNYAKRAGRHRNQMVEYTDALEQHISYEGTREDSDGEFHGNVITALLNALNPDQRACIVLRNVEGLSYQEIAEALKIPINTVRTRIKRAREAMLALRKEVMNNEL